MIHYTRTSPNGNTFARPARNLSSFDLRDTQIGAIAREYGLTVATRNVKHFPFCATENPFA
jgi:predicted nucleic acid-binding protein